MILTVILSGFFGCYKYGHLLKALRNRVRREDGAGERAGRVVVAKFLECSGWASEDAARIFGCRLPYQHQMASQWCQMSKGILRRECGGARTTLVRRLR